MSTLGSLFLVFFSLSMFLGNLIQAAEQPRVDSPQAGAVLQGKISIIGSTDVLDFQSAEISFRYEVDPTDTWYLIQQSREKVVDGVLASWDTTTIADGEYRLRLTVIQANNRTIDVTIPNLRVRNYSPVETVISEPKNQTAVMPTLSQLSPTAPPKSIPTNLPINPAQISTALFDNSLLQGILISGILFGLLAIYLSMIGFKRR
jgi:hypothetical protein